MIYSHPRNLAHVLKIRRDQFAVTSPSRSQILFLGSRMVANDGTVDHGTRVRARKSERALAAKYVKAEHPAKMMRDCPCYMPNEGRISVNNQSLRVIDRIRGKKVSRLVAIACLEWKRPRLSQTRPSDLRARQYYCDSSIHSSLPHDATPFDLTWSHGGGELSTSVCYIVHSARSGACAISIRASRIYSHECGECYISRIGCYRKRRKRPIDASVSGTILFLRIIL